MERKSAAWELERDACLSPQPGKLQIYSVGRPNRSISSLQRCREQPLSPGFAVAGTVPRYATRPALGLRVLPHVWATPGLIRLRLRFRERNFRAFQPYSLTKGSSWPLDEEKPQPGKVCFADRQTLRRSFASVVKYFISLCWKLLLGVD